MAPGATAVDPPAPTDIERTFEVGLDLVRETLADELASNPDRVRESLNTVLQVIRESGELREKHGGELALGALCGLKFGSAGRDTARAWSQLTEPFVRRLLLLSGDEPHADRDLRWLLDRKNLIASPCRGQPREAWIAASRRLADLLAAAEPSCRAAELRAKLADRACGGRNRSAHGNFPETMSLLEQVALIEAALTTMVAFALHVDPVAVRKGLLWEDLQSNHALVDLVARQLEEPTFIESGLRWHGSSIGLPAVLNKLSAASVALIRGPRGCGRTRLAQELCARIAATYHPGGACPVWLEASEIAILAPQRASALARLAAVISQRILYLNGREDLEREIQEGFYHIIVDGLELCLPSEAENVIGILEQCVGHNPNLKLTLTFASDDGSKPAILGLLQKGTLVEIEPFSLASVARQLETRLLRPEKDAIDYLKAHGEVAHVLGLPRFLFLGSWAPQEMPVIREEAISSLLDGCLDSEAHPVWDLPAILRPTASVLARAALSGIATAIVESADRRLNDAESDEAIATGLARLIATFLVSSQLVAELRLRLATLGLTVWANSQRTTRLVHPEMERLCSSDEFQTETQRKWQALGQAEPLAFADLLARFPYYTTDADDAETLPG